MPDTLKLEKLNRELEKSEKKLRKAINDEKALQHQLKQLTASECVGCHACESRCPFGVPIAERMEKTAELFGC